MFHILWETFKRNLKLYWSFAMQIEMKIWKLTLCVEGLPSFFWTVLEAAGSRGCSAGWLRLDGFSDEGESPFLKEKQISNQILASNPCDMGSFNNYVEKMRWVGRWSIKYLILSTFRMKNVHVEVGRYIHSIIEWSLWKRITKIHYYSLYIINYQMRGHTNYT